MISFDLKCDGGHIFEIWFRSSADYESQRTAGHVLCPVCGDHDVIKAVMAPAVAAKANRQAHLAPPKGPMMTAVPDAPSVHEIKALMQAIAEAQAKSLKDSQWVGAEFADRARAMHYGDAKQEMIHGTANARDARAMMKEGLAVAPLLVPIAPPDQTN
jgi:hypothetical protein